ncbi:MAG: metallophosphoesterase [Clostridia bacterium]|nr:metallophosphoesterase [Clostridia bacterium]
MNIFMILALCLIFSIYGLINYYIGFRLWQSLGTFLPFLHPMVYWGVFMAIAFSYILGRMATAHLPKTVTTIFTLVGSYWMGAMVYLLLILAAIDLMRFIGWAARLLTKERSQAILNSPFFGAAVVLIVIGIVVYGIYNANHPLVKPYNIVIPKNAEKIDKLHVVMISDMHLGMIVKKNRVTQMVETVNGLNPDVVILAGDIIDEDIEPFIQQNMSGEFRKLKAKYGVFAALGNHEYYGGQIERIVDQLEKSNITVLRDRYIKLEESLYIAGREDRDSRRALGVPRKALSEVLNGIDASLPLILIDHNPSGLQEAEKSGVDLQLSGHTHRGQLFPNQWITQRMYEVDWGYLKKGNLQVVVSSGFGTWGAPMRTGNNPEIVDLNIQFTKP